MQIPKKFFTETEKKSKIVMAPQNTTKGQNNTEE